MIRAGRNPPSVTMDARRTDCAMRIPFGWQIVCALVRVAAPGSHVISRFLSHSISRAVGE